MFRQAADEITRHGPRPPARRRQSAVADELWRWHRRKVFTHQFHEIAVRRVPVAAQVVSTVWDYRHRFDRPVVQLGLVAAKYAQAAAARENLIADSRLNSGFLARRHGRLVENEVSTAGRLSKEELRLIARASYIAGLKLQQKTLYELCQMHLANGTLAQFLKSLRYG